MAVWALISEENRVLFCSLTSELNSLRQSLQELNITCYCTESDCPFRDENSVDSRRHHTPEVPAQSPVSPKTSIKRWIVRPSRSGAAATEPQPRPKSAVLYLPDDMTPNELIKQKQVDSVNQKYSQRPRTWAWENCEEEEEEEEDRHVSGLVFVRNSRTRTNIRLRRCSSAGCN